MEAATQSPSDATLRATKAGARKVGSIETRPNNHDHPAPGDSIDGDSCINSPSTTSPPYWIASHSDSRQRSSSNVSVDSLVKDGIILQDNTDGDDSRNRACWAKSVLVESYTIVGTGLGAFVVWNVNVETLQGGSLHIRKRYSEFDDLRHKLIQTFPYSEAAMPAMPRKSVISKFRPKFLEQRRAGLHHFLNCILLNPEFSSSPVLKEFLFS
ncbi:hypothetical protein HYFRA_00012331 [Hymenoscyphus fraxineus]|uniref:Endosomal/vacuolar adapter protein YPT35 n=1 Tax=Hymenoscyphus fraxineus TaxID=746836 RepID=A0A9N9KZE7_9HELO|nr:hypothetical protein HYFRA_00012331 [Hymenoscyphus fraxineus]